MWPHVMEAYGLFALQSTVLIYNQFSTIMSQFSILIIRVHIYYYLMQ